jgi:hypothetical protein
MIGHLPRLDQRTVTFHVVGYAGAAHRVSADAGFDARPLCMALYQPIGVLLPHPVRPPGRVPHGAEQRPVFVAPDARRRNVLIQAGFQFGLA